MRRLLFLLCLLASVVTAGASYDVVYWNTNFDSQFTPQYGQKILVSPIYFSNSIAPLQPRMYTCGAVGSTYPAVFIISNMLSGRYTFDIQSTPRSTPRIFVIPNGSGLYTLSTADVVATPAGTGFPTYADITNYVNAHSSVSSATNNAGATVNLNAATATRALIATNKVFALSYDSETGGWTNGAGTQVVGANGLVLGGGVGGTVTLSASTLSADASVITGTLLGSSVGAVTSVAGPLLTTNGNQIVPSYNGGRLTNLNTFTNRQELWVDANGGDSNPGTKERPFLTITNAVAKMGVSNTVYIFPGTYNTAKDRLKIPVGGRLIGNNATLISDWDDVGAPILVPNDNSVIDGITLICNTNGSANAGVWGAIGNYTAGGDKSGCTNFIVRNIRVINSISDVIYMGDSDSTGVYQGYFENIYWTGGRWDGLAFGGGTNSSYRLSNCKGETWMNVGLGASATFIRATGNTTIELNDCSEDVAGGSNTTGISPWLLLGFTGRMYVNGGRYSIPIGTNAIIATSDQAMVNGQITGQFLYSTNGTQYELKTCNVTNAPAWTYGSIGSVAESAFTTNSNRRGTIHLGLVIQASSGAFTGSKNIQLNLYTVGGGVTNLYSANMAVNQDMITDGIENLVQIVAPISPKGFWYWQVDQDVFGSVVDYSKVTRSVDTSYSRYVFEPY